MLQSEVGRLCTFKDAGNHAWPGSATCNLQQPGMMHWAQQTPWRCGE